MEYQYKTANSLPLSEILKKYEDLTFPSIRVKLKSIPLEEPFNAVLALKKNNPIGLVISDTNLAHSSSEVFSFYVRPEERGQGIGSKLFNLLEQEIEKKEINVIRTRYWSNWKSQEAIRKILVKANWKEPKVLRTIYYLDIGKVVNADWPKPLLAEGISIIKWEELTFDEKEQLRNKKDLPTMYNPFTFEEKIFSSSSVVAKKGNEILGWNIGYKLRQDTIEYNNLYVFEKYRSTGLAIALLKTSSLLQNDSGIPYVTYFYNMGNTIIKKLTERIAQPIAEKMIQVFLTSKTIKKPSSK